MLRIPFRPAAVAAATLALLAACAAGPTGGERVADSSNGVPSSVVAQAQQGGVVQSTPRGTITSSAARQRFLSQPRPADIVAEDWSGLEDAMLYSRRATEGEAARVRGARWVEAAQIGLLFGSPEGKAFLSAPAGRALVRGEPRDKCPALNVASAPTDDQATDGALRACLREIQPYGPDCGCRVIARADRLLAPRDEFEYAIGVATRIVDPATGNERRMTSEERMIDGRPGARRLWLLGVQGPVGMLQVEPDGRAAFIESGTNARYDGKHRAEGFRRGRVARRAYLTARDGRRLVVLVGFEEEELKDNRAALTAWNPDGPLLLKAEVETD